MTWMGRWKFCFYNQRVRAQLIWDIYIIQPLVCFSLSCVCCPLHCDFPVQKTPHAMRNMPSSVPLLLSLLSHILPQDWRLLPSRIRTHSTIDPGAWGHVAHLHQSFLPDDSRALWLVRPKPLTSPVIDKGKGWRKGGKTCMRLQKLMGRSWGNDSVALPEDWGSIPGTYMREITTISNSNSKGSNTLFWIPEAPTYTWKIHTDISICKNNKNKS